MDSSKKSPQTIDEYMANFPAQAQTVMQRLRALIHEIAPEATEKISYGIPTFVLGQNLVHFAAYKNHIGFYPRFQRRRAFRGRTEGLRNLQRHGALPVG